MNHQEAFAKRVRTLRLAAGLSIERASELGGLTPGFWGDVERNVKEPCLESLYGFAHGLDTTVPILLTLDEQVPDSKKRAELTALLDLFKSDQLQFIHSLALLVFGYRRSENSDLHSLAVPRPPYTTP